MSQCLKNLEARTARTAKEVEDVSDKTTSGRRTAKHKLAKCRGSGQMNNPKPVGKEKKVKKTSST